ncbi:Acetyltransferase (isoleucine patch superfamily) [Candidatus Paraburkholderia calva]|nr:Acetyltransferase (isoleucine patch superfamily) [Candidatus Paraburkholderia calva]
MSNAPLYVLGGGGHAKVVIDTLKASGATITGVIDPKLGVGTFLLGVPGAGGDELMQTLDPRNVRIANGVGATVKSRVNRKLYEIWTEHGFRFVSMVHPSAIIGAEVKLAEGCQIMAGAIVQPHARIGTGTVINTAASIDHDCVVGAHCFVAPSVTLCGDAQVGPGCFIGASATLLPGVKVGPNVLIAAGAMVDSDVADGAFVAR